MPIYEYRCDACGCTLEQIQKFNEPALTDCPKCGEPKLKKMISAAGFQLKGTGWYATDFKTGGVKTKDAEKSTDTEKSKDTGKEKDVEKTKDKKEKPADKTEAAKAGGTETKKAGGSGGGSTGGVN
jgi:putative FmdB family regulatory protein